MHIKPATLLSLCYVLVSVHASLGAPFTTDLTRILSRDGGVMTVLNGSVAAVVDVRNILPNDQPGAFPGEAEHVQVEHGPRWLFEESGNARR